jgi:hypothetical protein
MNRHRKAPPERGTSVWVFQIISLISAAAHKQSPAAGRNGLIKEQERVISENRPLKRLNEQLQDAPKGMNLAS